MNAAFAHQEIAEVVGVSLETIVSAVYALEKAIIAWQRQGEDTTVRR